VRSLVERTAQITRVTGRAPSALDQTAGCGSPASDSSADRAGGDVSSAWYAARSCSSSSFFGKRKKTSTAPSRIATAPAVYAHWSPSRNDDFAAAVIWLAYCGCCSARFSALANESCS